METFYYVQVKGKESDVAIKEVVARKVHSSYAMTSEAFEAATNVLHEYVRGSIKRLAKTGERGNPEPSKDETYALDRAADVLSCAFWPEWMMLSRAKAGPLKHAYHCEILEVIACE